MTLLTMEQLASDYLDDVNNAYFTKTQLDLRLNLACKETQKRLILAGVQYYSLAVKTSTVVGQEAYALPSDFLNIVRLDYVTSGSGTTATEQKIYSMTPNQRDLVSATSGPPRYYFMQNNNLMLSPVPDTIYELRLEYTYFIGDMLLANDAPDIPQQFHEYAVLLAVRDFKVKDNQPLGNIETKLKEYEELMKQFSVERLSDGARMIISTDALEW